MTLQNVLQVRNLEDENYANPYFIVKNQHDENGFVVNDRLYFRVADHKADLLPRAGGYLLWFNLSGYVMAILGAFGIANMWVAIFADVGVMVIAVLNAIRALSTKNTL